MTTLTELLLRGYFPKELPSPFWTQPFATAVGADTAGIRTNLLGNRKWTKLCAHSLARPGSVRRRLGIPNPIAFLELGNVIAANFGAIDALIRRSPYSRSIPVKPKGTSRALVPEAHDGSLPDTRAQRRCAAKYLVQADIANFYPSIYTHGVPWAIETKAASKARLRSRGSHPYADDLDAALRNCQDGQTLGVPIGSDTSLVVAELVLSEVDRLLQLEAPPSAGLRYYDDYELSYPTHAAATRGLAALQAILSDFQLELNRLKTRVAELLQPLDRPWVNKLRSFSVPRTGDRLQRVALLSYFDALNELSAAYPDDNVVEYAIGRLWRQTHREELSDYNAILIQNLVLQVLLARPSSSVECYQLLTLLQNKGLQLDLASLAANANSIIESQAGVGHDSEVAWAVWACMRFNLKIEKRGAAALSSSSGDVVVLLALDANAKGLVDGGLDTSKWLPLMNGDELLGEHWLLSYEANVKGWLPSLGPGDHVAGHHYFAHLKAAGVSFYDDSPGKLNAFTPPEPKIGSP